MPKYKSNKVKRFRAVDVSKLCDSTNNVASKSNTATSGTPSETFCEQNDYKSGKESPHIEDKGNSLTEESYSKTSNAYEVASSNAMGAFPETMADEMYRSSETTSESTNEISPPKIERDVTYSKNTSNNNRRNKEGRNYNLPYQQVIEEEKSSERSRVDTTGSSWKVAVSNNMVPDCSQLEEKVKRPLNRDAPEFKPKSHCSGINEQAENISYSGIAKKSNRNSEQPESIGTENEIVRSHQQKTVEDTHKRRDGNDNYHKQKPGFNRSDHRSQSKEYTNSSRHRQSNDYHQEDSKINYSEKNQRSFNKVPNRCPSNNETVSLHQQKTMEDAHYERMDGSDNCHKQKPGFNRSGYRSRSKEYTSSSGHRQNDDHQEDSKSNYSEVQNRFPSNSRDEETGGYGYNQRKKEQTFTHNKHGKPGNSESKQNWLDKRNDHSSHAGFEHSQGTTNLTSLGGGSKYNQRRRDSTFTHYKHGKPGNSESKQNWDDECNDQSSHTGSEHPQGTTNLTSLGGGSKYNQRKSGSTFTQNKHGNPENSESKQNWDDECNDQSSHTGFEHPQGTTNLTSFGGGSKYNQRKSDSTFIQNKHGYPGNSESKQNWDDECNDQSSHAGSEHPQGTTNLTSLGGGSKYNQRKGDSTFTQNKHGKPGNSESKQNWNAKFNDQSSHKVYEQPQGATDSTSYFQNEATSNRQPYIESISKMNIRDDNNSAMKIRDTSVEVLPTTQKARELPDPRMEREAGSKPHSNEICQEKRSKKQKKPSRSPQNVDNSYRTEEQNTSSQGDKDRNSQDVPNSGYTEVYDGWNDTNIKQNKSFPSLTPKHEADRKSAGGRIERSSKDDFDRSYEKTDVEYREFNQKFRWNFNFDYVKVTEKEQDLFEMSKDYSLGHCVAEDLRMGSGIAVTFKRLFKRLDDLLSQNQKQGGVAILEDNNRYIYYLVTKRISTGKPTYETFWKSLKNMREHIVNHRVQKLAIPKIGCGLDRLEWAKVKYMIEFLFKDVDVEIVVCDFQQMDDTPKKDSLSTRLVYHHEPLKDIDRYTIILYFSTEDGHISKEMEELDKKCNFLAGFRRSVKKLGFPIRYETKEYILYGCIVREKLNKLFDFKSFAKCLYEVDKNNRKDGYEYVALQPVHDETDDLLNEKVITLLRNCLRKVDIYICSGETPEETIVNH